MKAIILAAGYATRLHPLTLHTPKPLLDIGGRTILDRLLDRLTPFETLDIVYVVTNAKFAPHFREWGAQTRRRFDVQIVDDGTTDNDRRLGAIADVQFVIKTAGVDDDLIVAAGDNVFLNDFHEMARFFAQTEADVILAQCIDDPARLRQRGVVEFDGQRRVIGFEEKPKHPRSEYVCPALYLHKRRRVPLYGHYLSEGGNPDAPGHFIRWLYRRAPLVAYVLAQPSLDIGTLATYERVQQELAEGRLIF